MGPKGRTVTRDRRGPKDITRDNASLVNGQMLTAATFSTVEIGVFFTLTIRLLVKWRYFTSYRGERPKIAAPH